VNEQGLISSGILLGFGMAIREAQRCQFLECNEPLPEDMPPYVGASFVGQHNVVELMDHIDSVISLVVYIFFLTTECHVIDFPCPVLNF
jgi:hypothetical protein